MATAVLSVPLADQATEGRATLAIVMPVYNDWMAAEELLRRALFLFSTLDAPLIVLVDDHSDDRVTPGVASLGTKVAIEVTRLAARVGHQRAIAHGLEYVSTRYPCRHVLIMDADGQDDVGDIRKLLNESQSWPGHIISAERRGRSEGLVFVAFYEMFQVVCRWFTGTSLRTGNFCLIPPELTPAVRGLPLLPLHLAASIQASGLPIKLVPLRRKARLVGQSHMSMVRLIRHGATAILVKSGLSRLAQLGCPVRHGEILEL